MGGRRSRNEGGGSPSWEQPKEVLPARGATSTGSAPAGPRTPDPRRIIALEEAGLHPRQH